MGSVNFAGRVALVTGGSRGIGRAIAERLAAAGAAVVVHFNQSQVAADATVQAIRSSGGRAFPFSCDLASPEALRGFYPGLDAARPNGFPEIRPDILVCNAAIGSGRKTIETVGEAELDLIFRVNFKAPFLLIQGALPRMTEGGRIITISSMATRTAFPELAVYAPSKAALEALTVLLAAQLGPRGITVNAVLPGATETDMNPISADPVRLVTVTASVAMRRVGQPQDIAGVVAFLASEEGGWVTGQKIEASGGQRL